MNITLRHHLDADIARIVEVFTNVDFACARANAAGATEADAVVDRHDDGGATIAISRIVPSESIPKEMSSLVGGSLDVKYVEVWEAPQPQRWKGTFAIDIIGTPGRVTGDIVVVADESGSVVTFDGVVKAAVPLFGSMVEKALAQAVEEAFDKELAVAREWVTST